MKASEAKKEALENAKSQIAEVVSTIEASVKNGETSTIIYYPLLEGTKIWLETNGYKWQYFDVRFFKKLPETFKAKVLISWK